MSSEIKRRKNQKPELISRATSATSKNHEEPQELPETLPVTAESLQNDNLVFRILRIAESRIFLLSLLTILSFATRLYQIHLPDWVCWDETHFGKMASWYINRTFFFDVHPPLGKMSIAFVGYLTGYNGTFAWDKPGDRFHGHPYVGMRIFCAVLGALLVPLAFETVYSLSRSVRAATVAGLCLLCDTGMITLTRYILLDAPLLFFIMASVWACVSSWPHEDASGRVGKKWWMWNCACGAFLSCAISVKFVGVFVVLWVGFATIFRLLLFWCDRHFSVFQLIQQFFYRAVCLILIPAICYVGYFAVHLAVLNRSGPGDGFYSSAFQSVLLGNPLNNATMPGEVAYGAMIALKNTKANGAYLHSHHHLYPEVNQSGSVQQQVTCYSHKDDNNVWQLRKIEDDPEGSGKNVELLRHGDLLRLTHVVTGRNLHAHKAPAPVTRHHYQVSGYGNNGTGDVNDLWQVVVENGHSKESVKTMTSHFRLVHFATKCALQSGEKQLPKWAWEQMEVTCNPRPKKSSFDKQLFHVEWVFFPSLPNVTFSSHAPSFLRRFTESHHVMIKGNSGLKPKEGESFSRPWQWPIDLQGQFFSAGEVRIYLLGNPIIWWGNIIIWTVYGALEIFLAVRVKRKLATPEELKIITATFIPGCRWMFFGWSVHYLPFYGMGRILYYHHYFPAHLFACMLTGLVIELLLNVIKIFSTKTFLKRNILPCAYGLVVSSLFLGFYLFYPLAYGMTGSFADQANSSMYGRRWLRTWEF